jgi:hypothetical protein
MSVTERKDHRGAEWQANSKRLSRNLSERAWGGCSSNQSAPSEANCSFLAVPLLVQIEGMAPLLQNTGSIRTSLAYSKSFFRRGLIFVILDRK